VSFSIATSVIRISFRRERGGRFADYRRATAALMNLLRTQREASMTVALISVSLGIANAPEPFSHPLVVSYFADMTSCVEAANQAKLPAAGTLGRSLNTWVQFVCVPAKPIVP